MPAAIILDLCINPIHSLVNVMQTTICILRLRLRLCLNNLAMAGNYAQVYRNGCCNYHRLVHKSQPLPSYADMQ